MVFAAARERWRGRRRSSAGGASFRAHKRRLPEPQELLGNEEVEIACQGTPCTGKDRRQARSGLAAALRPQRATTQITQSPIISSAIRSFTGNEAA
jgi:hypothetical protein